MANLINILNLGKPLLNIISLDIYLSSLVAALGAIFYEKIRLIDRNRKYLGRKNITIVLPKCLISYYNFSYILTLLGYFVLICSIIW